MAETGQTEFRVLGPLEVVVGGRALTLGSGRQALLLSCLLLHANEVVPRDRLIDVLWGERPPPTAPNALQVQVHALRKRLSADRILTEGPGYRLRVEPGELDLEKFERLVAHGRSELAAGDAEAAAATLREALALWRGPALVDVAYESFAEAEAGRLDELRLVALEELVDARLALAKHLEVVPELEALVAAQPLRERLHGQLMLALYRAGRQGEALAAFRRVRRELRDELGLEPGRDLQELQQAILRHDASLRVEPPELRARRHLPAPQTPLVGRRQELDELSALLRSGDARLVTLTGIGGSGKTRLALQVAHDLADAFPDGVHFVDLAHLREPELVPSTIAHLLGLEEHGDDGPLDALVSHLRGRRLLLLLDNFEVVAEAAPVLSPLLQASAGLAALVTSRSPLRLSGEHEYRVPPLPLGDAVQLFAARARAVAPGFRRPSEEADEVAEICRRLDRLPLALELAAARTREYAPSELLELLPGALELADAGARDLPARQRTFRATIDWSYDLLADEEREALARLGVFAGGCTLRAAEVVAGAHRHVLASLVENSLLRERPRRSGLRYTMLETMREYARERLEESSDRDGVFRRHAEYYADFAESARNDPGAPGEKAWPRLEEEHDNFRAAIAWCREVGETDLELRLVVALARFWRVRGHLREGRDRLDAALRREGGAPSLRMKALKVAGSLSLVLGDIEHLRALAEEGLALSRSLDDRDGMAAALDSLGIAVSHDGDLARARSLHEEAAAISRELGDQRALADSLGNLGYLALIEGDYNRATSLNEEAVALFETIDNPEAGALPLVNLGLAAFLDGRPDEALQVFRHGLTLAHGIGYLTALVYCLEGLAAVYTDRGEAERAALLLGAAGAGAEATGISLEPFERELHEQTVQAAQDALGADAFAAAFAAGRQLDGDEAVSTALGVRAEDVAGHGKVIEPERRLEV